MSPPPRGWAVLIALLAIASPGSAQQRPSEEELFGPAPDGGVSGPREPTPPSPEAATQTPASSLEDQTAKGKERSRDERELSSKESRDLFATEPTRDNPLTIGGQIYLRSIVQGSEGQALGKDRFLLPALVDGYFDARPSDRVRGMILGRLTYDPTLDANGNANLPNNAPGFGSGSNTTGSNFTLPISSNPAVLLDQLWVNFDIARTLFITAGKQHVKWGVSRFWNPTDFLTPQRRDPLAVFDPRLGATMVKVHLPSERGWNLYAIGLIDNAGPASTLGQLGGVVRGEIAFARSEVGAEAVYVPGRPDRYGIDASSAIGPLDVYAEGSLRKGSDGPVFQNNPNPDPAQGYLGLYQRYTPTNYNVSVSGGFNTTITFRENDNLVLGVEYFYNGLGYDSDRIYPYLIFQDVQNNAGPRSFQPFYLGKHYGAVYATFTSPTILGENASFIFSTLSNLSDRSLITRVDFLTRVLSYLFLEAYADVHYGRHGGEFRLEINLPPQMVNGSLTPPIVVPAPLFDVGLGVRIKI